MPAIAKDIEKNNSNSQNHGVYAGFGANKNWEDTINTYENMSGPNYTNIFNTEKHPKSWFSFDLCEKYNRSSPLKQFHMLTFFLRDTKENQGFCIKATLPEQFTYSIGGVWGNPINLSGGETLNTLLQQISGGRASLRSYVDSYMVWQAPKRMEFVFKIKVFDDSGNNTRVNYQEALELLSSCVLPQVDKNGYYQSIPGPILTRVLNNRPLGEQSIRGSKTADNIAVKGDDLAAAMNGKKSKFDRITVQIGGLLLVDWCVIKDVKITYPNTKNQVLHSYIGINKANVENYKMHLQPLLAELEITIATVTSLTFSSYRSMLYLTEQKQPEDKLASDDEKTVTDETRRIYGYTSLATGREVEDDDAMGVLMDLSDQAEIASMGGASIDPERIKQKVNNMYGQYGYSPASNEWNKQYSET